MTDWRTEFRTYTSGTVMVARFLHPEKFSIDLSFFKYSVCTYLVEVTNLVSLPGLSWCPVNHNRMLPLILIFMVPRIQWTLVSTWIGELLFKSERNLHTHQQGVKVLPPPPAHRSRWCGTPHECGIRGPTVRSWKSQPQWSPAPSGQHLCLCRQWREVPWISGTPPRSAPFDLLCFTTAPSHHFVNECVKNEAPPALKRARSLYSWRNPPKGPAAP